MDTKMFVLLATFVTAVVWAPGYRNWIRISEFAFDKIQGRSIQIITRLAFWLASLLGFVFQLRMGSAILQLQPAMGFYLVVLATMVASAIGIFVCLYVCFVLKGDFPSLIEILVRGVTFVPVAFFLWLATSMLMFGPR